MITLSWIRLQTFSNASVWACSGLNCLSCCLSSSLFPSPACLVYSFLRLDANEPQLRIDIFVLFLSTVFHHLSILPAPLRSSHLPCQKQCSLRLQHLFLPLFMSFVAKYAVFAEQGLLTIGRWSIYCACGWRCYNLESNYLHILLAPFLSSIVFKLIET